MDDSRHSELKPCRFLKGKNSFGMLVSGENWHDIEDPNATYWCIKTSGAMGPDNGVVGPKQCQAKRKCYQASE